jgi:biotin transport system substrate-specific component
MPDRTNDLALAQGWPLKLAMVAGGSLLLWLSAKVQVPFWPVPMTLQTMAIMFIAAALGPVLGTATVLLYLLQGALGLPVFAGTPQKGIGLAYMAGPTGGYLLGFVLAAFVIGWLARRWAGRNPVRLFITFMLGLVALYVPGLLWLAQFTGWENVLAFGLWPFAPGELLKAAIVALALPAAWRLKRAA